MDFGLDQKQLPFVGHGGNDRRAGGADPIRVFPMALARQREELAGAKNGLALKRDGSVLPSGEAARLGIARGPGLLDGIGQIQADLSG